MITGRGGAARKREVSPLGLLGAGNCAGWWDWMSATDVSGAINNVPNRTGNGDLTQATSGQRPAASTLLGRRCSAGDGSDDTLNATLTTQIANGARSYGWAVMQVTALPSGGFPSRYTATMDNCLTIYRSQVSPAKDTALLNCTDGQDTIVGANADTNPHLFEAGFLSTTTARFVKDGVSTNGVKTGAANAADTTLYVHSLRPLSNGFETASKVQCILISAVEPTAGQIQGVRDYFRRVNYGLF